jgi:oxygen-independent coproporphyrinogen-3 oxidase
MFSFGVSSIARVGATYSQNARDLDTYYTRLAGGELPVVRGIELTADDLLRRDVINALMCQFAVSTSALGAQHGVDFGTYFARELNGLSSYAQLGLLELEPGRIAVTPKGRFFVRAIAGTFDRYLQSAETTAKYSKII